MKDCLFCKIKSGDIPSNKIFENENVFAFEDINPLGNIHWLVIHKTHTTDLSDMSSDPQQIAAIFDAINKIVKEHNLDSLGYRIFTNVGTKAGQSVFHTHFHILSDKNLATKWN